MVKVIGKWGVRISDATDQRQVDIFLENCKGFYSTKEDAAKSAVRCFIKYFALYEHGGDIGYLLFSSAFIEGVKSDLSGKNLSCWCKPGETCHVDWLLQIANE